MNPSKINLNTHGDEQRGSIRPLKRHFVRMKNLSSIIAIGCLLVASLLFFISGCHTGSEKAADAVSDSTYILTGEIEGLDSGWVYLQHEQTEQGDIDSVRADKSRFVFTGRAAAPEFCLF